ncbi:MAG TPA: HEAT repeat domain-containing protein [Archangium sp.]|uniref:HEAT repeat domain-containing protein n=1 Tax=Archangium sp. TaxID=1872627 RepID=UPI002E3756CC|nr:HEAT repeat domain-containing protein [Archangium sp.]HEX5751992.1 HEAT repeat domain-containing protein [Archangium sp.]
MTRTATFRTLLLALTLCPLVPTEAAAQVAAPGPALQGGSCSVEGLMDSIRRGLQSNSEAYKKYLRTLLRESAVTLPAHELQAAFERETDPVMAEHLATALVARTERGADPEAIKLVAKRALEERDPAVRAATVRSMRRTSALENTGDLYEKLVRDPSPEVRQEAATNIAEDIQNVYSGYHGPASDAAVSAAAASTDPKVTAKILGNMDTQKISAGSAGKIQSLLHSDDAQVRKAAALALGGVPAEQMASARQSVLAMYQGERDGPSRTRLAEVSS